MKITKQFYSYTQGKHVEDSIYDGLDLEKARHILEYMRLTYVNSKECDFNVKSFADMFTIKQNLDLVIYQIV